MTVVVNSTFRLSFFLSSLGFNIGPEGTSRCNDGYKIVSSEDACISSVAPFLGKPYANSGCYHFQRVGCMVQIGQGGSVFFNTCGQHGDGSIGSNLAAVCEQGKFCKYKIKSADPF